MSLHALKQGIKGVLPQALYRPLVTRWRRAKTGTWKGGRRLSPYSTISGLDRGRPVDRYYIEAFLQKHQGDIRGDVAEIMDASYTRQFGGSRVARSHVLDLDRGNPKATLVCDLESGEGVIDDAYDCFIVTQTYSSIYDVKAALHNSYRLLKPGGVLLATVPGIAKILRFASDDYGEYWRFTVMSARRLFEEVFPASHVSVDSGGNVFAAMAFLYGMVQEEVTAEELAFHDRDYEIIITIRAVKPATLTLPAAPA